MRPFTLRLPAFMANRQIRFEVPEAVYGLDMEAGNDCSISLLLSSIQDKENNTGNARQFIPWKEIPLAADGERINPYNDSVDIAFDASIHVGLETSSRQDTDYDMVLRAGQCLAIERTRNGDAMVPDGQTNSKLVQITNRTRNIAHLVLGISDIFNTGDKGPLLKIEEYSLASDQSIRLSPKLLMRAYYVVRSPGSVVAKCRLKDAEGKGWSIPVDELSPDVRTTFVISNTTVFQQTIIDTLASRPSTSATPSDTSYYSRTRPSRQGSIRSDTSSVRHTDSSGSVMTVSGTRSQVTTHTSTTPPGLSTPGRRHAGSVTSPPPLPSSTVRPSSPASDAAAGSRRPFDITIDIQTTPSLPDLESRQAIMAQAHGDRLDYNDDRIAKLENGVACWKVDMDRKFGRRDGERRRRG